MKTFRYKLGHEAGETLTVSELKIELSKYPDEMPVMATWEGVNAYIDSEDFEIYCVHKGNEEDEEQCLIIDVGRY